MDLDSLTIKKKRAESKVVSFPDDKEFREDKRLEREEEERTDCTSVFMQRMFELGMVGMAAGDSDE